MRVLLVAAFSAAVISASPISAADTEKSALFSEKRCSFYEDKLNQTHLGIMTSEKLRREATFKGDTKRVAQAMEITENFLTTLANYATVYSAVCKP